MMTFNNLNQTIVKDVTPFDQRRRAERLKGFLGAGRFVGFFFIVRFLTHESGG